MRGLGLAVAVVFAAGALAACGGPEEPAGEGSKGQAAAEVEVTPAKAEPTPTEEAPAAVKIVSARYVDVYDERVYTVRYELTNTGKEAGDFYAGLDFLDADGDVMGSTGITALKVGAGKTSRGDARPVPSEIDKGDIDEIKGVKVSTVERLD